MKAQRLKVKRLNLKRWMKSMVLRDEYEMNLAEINHLTKELPAIEPVIGRDGHYMTKDMCWFEYRGQAHLCPPKERVMFTHCLKTLNASEVDARAIFHIRKLIPMRYATKEQKDLVYYWLHWRELQKIRRGRFEAKST